MRVTYPNYELIEYICREKIAELKVIRMPTFKMWTFPQTWSNTATGFQRKGMVSGQAFTDEYTTVVEIRWYQKNDVNMVIPEERIYAVFFGSRFGYMFANPSEEFFKDFKAMNMKCVGDCYIYEGVKNDC